MFGRSAPPPKTAAATAKRSADRRERASEAQRLRAEGWEISKIAEQIKIDETPVHKTTVQRWLGTKK